VELKVSESMIGDEEFLCFTDIIKDLKSDLSGLPEISPTFGKSATIRKKMNELAKRNKWHKSVSINSKITNSDRKSNYFVEYMLDFLCARCNQTHRVNLELCFDNRQAMAANIFKLEIANANFISKRNSKCIGLIVCLTEKAKSLGQWDNSVGTFDEYILAIETAYVSYINTKIGLLSIDV
jgi:hypothetical protein